MICLVPNTDELEEGLYFVFVTLSQQYTPQLYHTIIPCPLAKEPNVPSGLLFFLTFTSSALALLEYNIE